MADIISDAWDETVPAATEEIKTGDNRMREMKQQIRERFQTGGHHHSEGTPKDIKDGRHTCGVAEAEGDASAAADEWYVYETGATDGDYALVINSDDAEIKAGDATLAAPDTATQYTFVANAMKAATMESTTTLTAVDADVTGTLDAANLEVSADAQFPVAQLNYEVDDDPVTGAVWTTSVAVGSNEQVASVTINVQVADTPFLVLATVGYSCGTAPTDAEPAFAIRTDPSGSVAEIARQGSNSGLTLHEATDGIVTCSMHVIHAPTGTGNLEYELRCWNYSSGSDPVRVWAYCLSVSPIAFEFGRIS